MLRSDDVGKHVLGVEDLLQKHLLMESQLSALGTRIRNLNKRAQPYMKSLQPETQLLQKRLEPLNKDYEKLVFVPVPYFHLITLAPSSGMASVRSSVRPSHFFPDLNRVCGHRIPGGLTLGLAMHLVLSGICHLKCLV